VFGNLNWIKDPAGGITTMKYDVVNRLKERTLPNGVKTVYEYDDLDRIESIVHTNAQGNVLTSVTYERTGIGEPSKITREDGSYVKLKYDTALRVEKESYYNASSALIKETTYEYDASGKRKVQLTSDGSRTFNYTNGYQLDTVTETGETENYDYDISGRLTFIERDGKTLDLDHDAYDRLTIVENETTSQTTQYIYDGAGNRIQAVSGSTERRFLVAPAMGGGLESTDLITDGNGNLISNYIYGGGSSPFMRLDANGNAVYYLTDAMGTVIGLADRTGQSAGKFLYDAFGNVLSQLGSDTTAGGDFRFQGQWLESESGLYHFRARDYDPATGLFLSRDAVDIIEMEPESFNPYQFVYNNPYIYIDPTGMFTMIELNTSLSIKDALNTIRTYASNEIKDYFKGKVSEVLGNAFTGLVKKLLPFGDFNFDNLPTKFKYGTKLENFLKGQICGILNAVGEPFFDRLWLEPGVAVTGEPTNQGLNCKGLFNDTEHNEFKLTQIPKGSKRPDFIFKKGIPTDYKPNNTDAFLIGDVKLTLSKALGDITGVGTKKNNPSEQWTAIRAYASKYEATNMALYITFKRFGKDDKLSDSDLAIAIAKASKSAFSKGVILLIANLAD
jgi:RHS repeat-associated protein